MVMHWTLELNDLLNQCVFECGYEFANACELLQSRARTLRLLPDGECSLTADACQVQWMTINPMDDDCDFDAHDGSSDACDFLSPQQLAADVFRSEGLASDAVVALADECEIISAAASGGDGSPESASVECSAIDLPAEPALPLRSPSSPTDAQPRRQASVYPLYECAPLLELSISDAELDLLISSLPPPSLVRAAAPEDDDSNDCSADAKHRANLPAAAAASEMQWVLSFLTNPDDAAQHDAEAKRLVEPLDKREDDNYQFFLQELSDANLLVQQQRSPAAPSGDRHASSGAKRDSDSGIVEAQEHRDAESVAVRVGALHVHEAAANSVVAGDDDSEDDDDDEDGEDDSASDDEDDEWEVVRRSIKSQVAGCSPGVKRAAATSSARRDGRLPPAPTRFARPRGAASDTNATMQPEAQRIALSREIGDLLQTHGAFQFPKRLFPHHNDSALEPQQP